MRLNCSLWCEKKYKFKVVIFILRISDLPNH
jgi:hypothetical protein